MKLKIEINLKSVPAGNQNILLAASGLLGNICSGEINEAAGNPGKKFGLRDDKAGIDGFYVVEKDDENDVHTVTVGSPAVKTEDVCQTVEGAMDEFFAKRGG